MYKYQKKGETLIEVLTAITTLALAALSAVTLIIAVMNSTAVSKDYLLAQNFARESIETVINIRDSNWLTFPSEKESEWMNLGCGSESKIDQTMYYKIETEESGCKKLIQVDASGLNITSPDNQQSFSFYKLYQDTNGIYTHGTSNPKQPQPFPAYYRSIKLTPIGTAAPYPQYEIESKVQWLNNSKVETYTLKAIIANYEK